MAGGILEALQAEKLAQEGRMAPMQQQFENNQARQQMQMQQQRYMQEQALQQARLQMEQYAQQQEMQQKAAEAASQKQGIQAFAALFRGDQAQPGASPDAGGMAPPDSRPIVTDPNGTKHFSGPQYNMPLRSFLSSPEAASGGPDVKTVPLPGKPEPATMTSAGLLKSLLTNNPALANDPKALAAAMDLAKPMLEDAGKKDFEEFKMQLKDKYPEAQSPEGKVAMDRKNKILTTSEDGLLGITDLPDAQSRKQAIEYQKSINTIPTLRDSFARAKDLNMQAFDSDALPANWKAVAARGMGSLAPLVGMSEVEAKARMTATTQYEQLIKQTILPRLRATFGGRVTNFETQFLNDIEGKTRMSQGERDALIDQSLTFMEDADAEARSGMQSLGVRITEPKVREGSTGAAAPAASTGIDKSDPRVQAAIKAGYSEEEIKKYLEAK